MRYVWNVRAWNGAVSAVSEFATHKDALEFFSECKAAGHASDMFRLTLRRDPAVTPARNILKSIGVNTLLSEPTANPKLAKNLGLKIYSAPLHLAPADLSGYNVCPMATAGCRKACLHTAGNPVFMPAKSKARIARTIAYYTKREAFLVVLVSDIEAHVGAARRRRMRAAIRLNATSDIRWERVPVIRNAVTYANIMLAFPHVTFYDYTKLHNRRDLPKNYYLTYSLAENNDDKALLAHKAGMNIAAVFNTARSKPLPSSFMLGGHTIPVIDGDLHDYRPIDPKGVIVGLRAKGQARGDKSGFVRIV